MIDYGKELQMAYDDGYKQGRYDEMVETEMSLPNTCENTCDFKRIPHAKDTIYRQDAIYAINALHEKPNAWLDSAVDAVMTLPSAQPERKPVIRCWCPKCGFEMIPTIDSEMKGDE